MPLETAGIRAPLGFLPAGLLPQLIFILVRGKLGPFMSNMSNQACMTVRFLSAQPSTAQHSVLLSVLCQRRNTGHWHYLVVSK
jgi:hypothetical protein